MLYFGMTYAVSNEIPLLEDQRISQTSSFSLSWHGTVTEGNTFFLEEEKQKNFWVKIYGLTELKLYMKTFSPHLACQDVSLMP